MLYIFTILSLGEGHEIQEGLFSIGFDFYEHLIMIFIVIMYKLGPFQNFGNEMFLQIN
jgi:hypothetical protein